MGKTHNWINGLIRKVLSLEKKGIKPMKEDFQGCLQGIEKLSNGKKTPKLREFSCLTGNVLSL